MNSESSPTTSFAGGAANSHLLSSFTAVFAFVALLADEVGECLNETGEASARIERINGYFSDLSELEGC